MSHDALFALAGALSVWRVAAVASAALVLLAVAWISRGVAARASSDVHIRGTRIARPGALSGNGRKPRVRASRTVPIGSPLRLGGIRIGSADETKHFKLIGTTGTGKSTAIAALLRTALARGDRAVIADPNGASLARFYERYRGDVLLNPFDPNSARWDPFAELRAEFDVENLARSLIPECEDASGREWRGYARTLIEALIRRCAGNRGCDTAEFWRLLAVADTAELSRLLGGTAAQPFLDADNARMFTSIRSVAVSALGALRHVAASRGRRFSVREWIVRGEGVLYMPYRADQIAALRSLIATWMRLAIFETLSGAELSRRRERCVSRRIWFIVDELDSLGAIDGLTDALARLRKFGGCCVLGVQSAAQVSGTYGAAGARALLENCANTLILRCSASESGGTAAFASQLIGEREVLRRQSIRSRDRAELFARRPGRRSTQIARQRVVEVAVLPSEIEQLPDLLGYFKTATSQYWRLIRLTPGE